MNNNYNFYVGCFLPSYIDLKRPKNHLVEEIGITLNI